MPNPHDKELVLNHVLQNEDNLGIALMVGAIHEELRRRVIAGFLAALEAELTSRLGSPWGLSICGESDRMLTRYTPLLTATYSESRTKFHFVLMAAEDGYPKYPYLAISRDLRTPVEQSLLDGIKQTIDQEYGPGKTTEYSVWWRYIDRPFADWSSEEVLLKLYRKDEAVSYFAEQLTKLARAVEKALATAANA